MYISKYSLNIDNSVVKQALNDVDKMHRLVWGLFEYTSDFCVSRESLNILYRVITRNDKIFLVIQSNMKPNQIMQSAVGEQIYCVTDEVMEIPRCFSRSIQSETACFAVALPFTEPAV